MASNRLIIAEKPSVARDIARVLDVRPVGRHEFSGRDCTITWCVGHLVELEEPAAYDARWKAWRLDTLPMLPDRFRLRGVKGSADQLRAVCALLRDQRFTEVINACDAGREGELIFRYVYELAQSRLPMRRLWISSMTDEAVRAGFARLRPGDELDNLAAAARCRSEADWLVGLNATRAVTVRHRTGPQSALFSIGRVQTPTLAILVEREKAIRDFQPRDYWEVKGTFTTADKATFDAVWTHDRVTRFGVKDAADAVGARTTEHAHADDPIGPVVHALEQKKTREPPPLLFDLTSLQRTANRRFGLSAQDTLQAAQALYEKHKVLTYPRTDSRYLSRDMIGELPKLFSGLARYSEYAPFARPLLDQAPPPSNRVFDDDKIQDHHAIVPTGKAVDPTSLGRDERRVFDLVVRRFLGIFYPDAVFALTEVVVRVGPGTMAAAQKPGRKPVPAGDAPMTVVDDDRMILQTPPPPDAFVARGRMRLEAGWQTVAGIGADSGPQDGQTDRKPRAKGDTVEEGATLRLPALAQDQRLAGVFSVAAKKTKPPPRHTEASLLSAMETAGRQIEDEELRAAMKDSGLGTPATRASIIETLIRRGFVVRQGKPLCATETGLALIDALPVVSLASPELTGQWEARLSRIARGQEQRAAFMQDIAGYVSEVVDAIRRSPASRLMQAPAPAASGPKKKTKERLPRKPRGAAEKTAVAKDSLARPPRFKVDDLVCPVCHQGHLVTGKRGWGCSRWRAGCKFVVWFDGGDDGRRLTKAALKKLLVARVAPLDA